MASLEQDVITQLHTRLGVLGFGGLTLGKHVRVGPPQKVSDNQAATNAVPHQCVFVVETFGRRGIEYRNGSATVPEGERFRTVQCWVRSVVNDWPGGKALAEGVFNAIHLFPPTGYYEAVALGGGPLFVRQDETGHYEWSVNVELRKQF